MFVRTVKIKNAFTLIELLVTISIIIILVSVLTLALNTARKSAQVAETTSRLSALSKATVRFKDDVGYYPAVLDIHRGLKTFPVFPPDQLSPDENQTYRSQAQEWYSITSPSEFLLGYGNRYDDGYGRTDDPESSNEMPLLGIRHPGMDGVWDATNQYSSSTSEQGMGTINSRDPSTRGITYGPYLEIVNEQMLGRLKFDLDNNPLVDPVTGQVKVFYPGDPDYEVTGANGTNPLVIVDTWGTPIRYYRTMYPIPNKYDPRPSPMILSGISKMFPPSNDFAVANIFEGSRPSLSDYFVLRPFDFPEAKVVEGAMGDYMDGEDGVGDKSTTFELQSGQFAFFSAGPDQKTNDRIRADAFGLDGNKDENATDEVNADNVVEVGP
ncbi:MAG: hypothetical protein QF718_06935 [Phycisphaerales bacterium]|nr:hypothetical protein [Phycisphaerales bacterium]